MHTFILAEIAAGSKSDTVIRGVQPRKNFYANVNQKAYLIFNLGLLAIYMIAAAFGLGDSVSAMSSFIGVVALISMALVGIQYYTNRSTYEAIKIEQDYFDKRFKKVQEFIVNINLDQYSDSEAQELSEIKTANQNVLDQRQDSSSDRYSDEAQEKHQERTIFSELVDLISTSVNILMISILTVTIPRYWKNLFTDFSKMRLIPITMTIVTALSLYFTNNIYDLISFWSWFLLMTYLLGSLTDSTLFLKKSLIDIREMYESVINLEIDVRQHLLGLEFLKTLKTASSDVNIDVTNQENNTQEESNG